MTRRVKTFIGICLATVLCLSIGGLSGYITQAAIPTWYAGLKKPFFTPPNWLFAPVWSLLYCLMGIAAGWVWSKGSHHRWVKTALYHFSAQLVVNGLWSVVFFGLKSPSASNAIPLAIEASPTTRQLTMSIVGERNVTSALIIEFFDITELCA